MPQIKRWHPISHDFNRDPQVVALRKEFGDWAALAWQECLSIADRNDDFIPGTLDEIASILAPVSLQMYHRRAQNAARMMLERFKDNSWITVERDGIHVVNYGKYHRTREPNRRPPDPTRPDPTIKEKKEKRNTLCADPEFPPDWLWLKSFIEKQNGTLPKERFLDWPWWDAVSETCGGISEDWLTAQFAAMQVWIMNHPARRPTVKGYRRFVSGWLARSYEKERRFPNAQKTR